MDEYGHVDRNGGGAGHGEHVYRQSIVVQLLRVEGQPYVCLLLLPAGCIASQHEQQDP
jgi:hypothetical protein